MADVLAVRDRELRQIQYLLRNVIDSLSPALIAVNGDCRLTLWNREAARLCSLASQTVPGLPLERVIGWLPVELSGIEQAVASDGSW